MTNWAQQGNIVAKFGGTSLATASQIERVKMILKANPTIKFLVVSAPGVPPAGGKKVTDMLLSWYEAAQRGEATGRQQFLIYRRFRSIAAAHVASQAWSPVSVKEIIWKLDWEFRRKETTRDYAASRGEYLMAKLMAEVLGWEFVDATKLIRFNGAGLMPHWDLSLSCIHDLFDKKGRTTKGFVIPGFYGANLDGEQVLTFSRGGSDVTGAMVAAALGLKYQNWTDTDGLMTADPRIVSNAKRVTELTYKEAEEAAYLGMGALHPLTLYQMIERGLEMWVKNTNNPTYPGTWIVPQLPPDDDHPVRLITGRADFSIVTIEQAMMNETMGFMYEVCRLFKENNVSIEHMPGGVNSLSVVIDRRRSSEEQVDKVASLISERLSADVSCEHDVALVSVIGADMRKHVGVAAKVISAIANAGVNIRLINQGASEVNITVAVREENLAAAIQAVHQACFYEQPALMATYPG